MTDAADTLARTAPPVIDEAATWLGLPQEAKLVIGGLAIREAFYRFAATTFQGHIVYLDLDGRQAADNVADQAAELLRDYIHDKLPELFGESGTEEDPEAWTDPAWARPFQIDPGTPVVVEMSEFAVDRALMKAQRKANAANRRADEAERQLAFVRRALDVTRSELAEARMRTGVHVQDARACEVQS